MLDSIQSLGSDFIEMNQKFISGECITNFKGMSKNKQNKTAIKVFLISLAAGLFTAILGAFIHPILGLALGGGIAAFVAMETFAYLTFVPQEPGEAMLEDAARFVGQGVAGVGQWLQKTGKQLAQADGDTIGTWLSNAGAQLIEASQ